LRTAFGASSKTLAHLEGDRFAATVALQDSEINALMQHWISQLQFLPFTNEGNELHIGLRLGIALFPDDGNSADLLFRNAEAALQRARRTGQPCVFYSPEMNARIAESLRFESRLHRAVEQMQFELYYQPKVDVKSRKICGLEALIRSRPIPAFAIDSLLEKHN
jgi:predicted signal transduction protein with EAL and GGDEF domain